ncbi:MAG: bifunctional transaldolase/phosoglucose isomerase [Chloroflexota bacterium]|nr:MAG: bifunctional transaldolase/phosoglucose isomerase [Chloroflexota bacterium]
MVNAIHTLHSLGQSLWYDNIQRRMLENGELTRLIEAGELRGMTSNPSIFNQAIAKSSDYDDALKAMAWAGYSTEQIMDRLFIEDIRLAADLFLPLYKETNGGDGYVSIEVRPNLAADTKATFNEASRLWEVVNRPNLMVKIPATPQGIPAIRQAIARGININITLIFSIARYMEVMDAYLSGLEDRLKAGKPVNSIASVASFFVSRIDTKADKMLENVVRKEGPDAQKAAGLLGKVAIANAKLAYARFREVFQSERFARLQSQGARLQRPLWASTSTKNPGYPDTLYVNGLIGPDTVNTIPPQTLDAFRDHGEASLTLEENVDEAQKSFDDLEKLGISIDQITLELEEEGVKAFAEAYDDLTQTIETRRVDAVKELGPLAKVVAGRVAKLQEINAPGRMRSIDPTLWTDDPEGRHEIRKRMGWLTLPEKSRDLTPDIRFFMEQVHEAGYSHVLLLGMGGSSLASEVMSLVFDKAAAEQGLSLMILDSTDPAQVKAASKLAPVERTLYIVSSKSGGTAEINAQNAFFWDIAQRTVGNHAPDHFVAITDPNTSLEELAKERDFRRVFNADPKVGGRYSALTAFGLVPAGLMGIDLERLLDRAAWMERQSAADVPAGRNPGLVLGAVIGEAALQGRDKLTLIADDEFSAFGAWLEQLVAESSGKLGRGIVPIDSEAVADPAVYGSDRLFVYLRTSGQYDQQVGQLLKAGHPVLTLAVTEAYDLGAEFYRWEVAIAIACAVIGVNPFDQPDVQDNKKRTLDKIEAYHATGKLEEMQPLWQGEGFKVYGQGMPEGLSSVDEFIARFLEMGKPGDYVALNAYLPRSPEMNDLLQQMRIAIRNRTHLATTIGFGPRFLHSTGQLHKGGANNGLYLQITSDPVEDIEIPGQGLTFGTLEKAQAIGDFESLLARNRRVLRVHLPRPSDLTRLAAAVKA